MTVRSLCAFDVQAGKLHATELLELANAIAVGTGSVDEKSSKAWQRAMQDAAGIKRKVIRAASPEERIAHLQAQGMGVEVVPVSADVIAARLAERDRRIAAAAEVDA